MRGGGGGVRDSSLNTKQQPHEIVGEKAGRSNGAGGLLFDNAYS
jgi:hypothetical protein